MPERTSALFYDELITKSIYAGRYQGPRVLDLDIYIIWSSMYMGRGTEMDYEQGEQDIKNQERLACQFEDIKYFEESHESFTYLDFETKVSKAKQFIESFEKYPPSHNRNLVLGALEYVAVAIRKIIEITLPKQVEFFDFISDYLDAISTVVSLSPEEFMDKHILDVESLFKEIESFCFENELLPRIDENNINLENFL